jgi:hypothetical protein
MFALKMKYCKCGSLIINNKCTNRSCMPRKSIYHIIGEGHYKFDEPVTFKEAQQIINKSFKILRNYQHRRYYA